MSELPVKYISNVVVQLGGIPQYALNSWFVFELPDLHRYIKMIILSVHEVECL